MHPKPEEKNPSGQLHLVFAFVHWQALVRSHHCKGQSDCATGSLQSLQGSSVELFCVFVCLYICVCVCIDVCINLQALNREQGCKDGRKWKRVMFPFIFHVWNHSSENRGLRKLCTVKSYDCSAKYPTWRCQQFPARLQYKQKRKNLMQKIPNPHEHCTKPNTFKQSEEVIKVLMSLETLYLDVAFAMVSVMWPSCSAVIQGEHPFNVRALCGSEGPL